MNRADRYKEQRLVITLKNLVKARWTIFDHGGKNKRGRHGRLYTYAQTHEARFRSRLSIGTTLLLGCLSCVLSFRERRTPPAQSETDSTTIRIFVAEFI